MESEMVEQAEKLEVLKVLAESLRSHVDEVNELIQDLTEKGLHVTIKVLNKMNQPLSEDEEQEATKNRNLRLHIDIVQMVKL